MESKTAPHVFASADQQVQAHQYNRIEYYMVMFCL